VAHQSENVLNKLRQQEIQATSETIDIILESVDVLKALMSEIKDNTGAQIDINTIKRKLSLLLEYSALLETSSDESEKPGETSLCHPELVSVSQMKPNQEILKQVQNDGNDNLTKSQEIKSDKPAGGAGEDKEQTLRIDTDRLDHVMDLVGELVLSRNRLSKILSDIEEVYDGDEKFS